MHFSKTRECVWRIWVVKCGGCEGAVGRWGVEFHYAGTSEREYAENGQIAPCPHSEGLHDIAVNSAISTERRWWRCWGLFYLDVYLKGCP